MPVIDDHALVQKDPCLFHAIHIGHDALPDDGESQGKSGPVGERAALTPLRSPRRPLRPVKMTWTPFTSKAERKKSDACLSSIWERSGQEEMTR